MLERRPGVAGSSIPYAIAFGRSRAEVADLRVVAVDHEHRLRRQLRRRSTPALGDVLELAVAVELVAEEVAEQHRARADAADDLRQRALVDLEQPELGVALGEQGRGDPGDEIRARAVPGELAAGLEDLRRHRRRRRLPVRRRDDGRAVRQPRRERVDRARIELPEQLARQRRAAAGAREAGELRGRARGEAFRRRGGRSSGREPTRRPAPCERRQPGSLGRGNFRRP